MRSKMRYVSAGSRTVEATVNEAQRVYRRITSKGQVTVPEMMRRRYNITMQTRLEFLPRSEGILLIPVREEGAFKELAGSASKCWTLEEMLKRLDQLRMENV